MINLTASKIRTFIIGAEILHPWTNSEAQEQIKHEQFSAFAPYTKINY